MMKSVASDGGGVSPLLRMTLHSDSYLLSLACKGFDLGK
jgi:hypothetical protein